MNTTVIAWFSSILLSVSLVWKYVDKYKGQVRKALQVSNEVLDVVNSVLNAIDDKKVTKEEVEAIVKHVEELQAILKG